MYLYKNYKLTSVKFLLKASIRFNIIMAYNSTYLSIFQPIDILWL